MSLPFAFLNAARAVLGDRKFNNHGFVPADETVTIGYVVGPGPHVADVASGVPVGDSQEGQTFSIRLEPDTRNPNLHWVLIRQSYGAVLYTWMSNDQTFHYLALATQNAGNQKEMEVAPAAAERRRLALQLHHETGLQLAVLIRLTRTAHNYDVAMQAINLAAWMLRQAEDNIEVACDRADRLSAMTNAGRVAELRHYMPIVNMTDGDKLMRICAGARVVLYRQTK